MADNITTKFKYVKMGGSFDFISGEYDSFFDRCVRISPRKYISINTGIRYTVGTINCKVYHVHESAIDWGAK